MTGRLRRAKIIHRDLKPQNLMVDKHYRIKARAWMRVSLLMCT
jgi:serine/threonine protein kinase